MNPNHIERSKQENCFPRGGWKIYKSTFPRMCQPLTGHPCQPSLLTGFLNFI